MEKFLKWTLAGAIFRLKTDTQETTTALALNINHKIKTVTK